MQTTTKAPMLRPISVRVIEFTIRGISPLMQHGWSEKAKRSLRDKGGGRKTKNREARDPDGESLAATYFTSDGEHGIPLTAFKKSLITAAHKDLGIEKTLVRKAFFIPCDDPTGILPMECDPPRIREDCVRVGAGSTDLRYRPEFANWRVRIKAHFDADLLQVEDIINLVNRAGFGVGIGENRPEKNGDNGRFEVDLTEPVNEHGVEQ